jgi:hypothetical protein
VQQASKACQRSSQGVPLLLFDSLLAVDATGVCYHKTMLAGLEAAIAVAQCCWVNGM